MSQSLARIIVHLVFSTKNREPWLDELIRADLHSYMGGIVDRLRGTLPRAGSVPDDIHLLILHPPTCAPAELVQEIKTGSAKWLKGQDRKYAPFHWQGGYRMFQSGLPMWRH